jgi:hypothetical protein
MASETFRRSGLHRVACTGLGCTVSAYQTIAQMKRGEMPSVCWLCGELMAPENWQLAGELYEAGVLSDDAMSAHPVTQAWQLEVEKVAKGQAPHVAKQRVMRSPEAVAEDRVLKAFSAERKSRQLAGLVQFSAAAQAAAEMPF